MNPASASTTALVALMRIKGVGRRAALRIVDGSSAELDHDGYRDALLTRAVKARLPAGELAGAWQRSAEQLEQSQAAGVQAFSIHDTDYPQRLRLIPDPPAVLFVRGDASALHAARSVAIVGTREPTSYGAKVAQKSGQLAAQEGFVIVSGLAHGCDTLGHEGCLEGHGVGVAVMAHGLDRVYPAANRSLADRLLEQGGCLVSEYPLGMAPFRTAFAERDRIQSGLADGVLVIETDVKGGTMHTVRFAREQGRPLACIAHPDRWLCEEKTRGNQKLVTDGWASPVPDGTALITFLDRIAPALASRAPTVTVADMQDQQAVLAF